MAVPRGILKSEYCLTDNLIRPLLPHINFVTLSYYQFIIYIIIILYYLYINKDNTELTCNNNWNGQNKLYIENHAITSKVLFKCMGFSSVLTAVSTLLRALCHHSYYALYFLTGVRAYFSHQMDRITPEGDYPSLWIEAGSSIVLNIKGQGKSYTSS